MKRFIFLITSTILFSHVLFAQDGVPQKINFQGCLEASVNETAEVTFNIFSAGSENSLWDFTATVEPVDCFFTIVLGEEKSFPEDLFTTHGTLSIELTVNNEVQPERFPINSTPYTIRAHVADRANIADAVTVGSVTSTSIADGTITDADIGLDAAIAIAKLSGDAGFNYTIINTNLNQIPTTGETFILGSMEIIAPTDGYVFLMVSGYATFFGDKTLLSVGLAKSTPPIIMNVTNAGRIDGNGTLRYEQSISVIDVTQVSAGFNIFHAIAARYPDISNNNVILRNVRLVGIFLPKRYNEK